MKIKRPKITVDCVADMYSTPGEKIIEFTFPDGSGGLIQFYPHSSGENKVVIYNHDPSVKVSEGVRSAR